jgi:DNA-binding FadR family transcriptional regulator
VTRTPALRPPLPVDSAEVAFRPIRSGNAFEECVERVLSAIKLGLVTAGERLPAERDLAARLGVSRVTLRDALRSLSDAGWLEVRRGRHGGTFVLERVPTTGRTARRRAALPVESLEDTLALRRVLELGAVELAASRPLRSDAEVALVAALEDTRGAGLQRYRIADSRLHLAITELTGAPSLVAAAADVRLRVNDLLDGIPLLERNIAHSEEQHARIVRAIRRGQPNAARAAMSEHLEGTTALLRGFLT